MVQTEFEQIAAAARKNLPVRVLPTIEIKRPIVASKGGVLPTQSGLPTRREMLFWDLSAALFVLGIPALAAWFGWKKGKMGRSGYCAQILIWGILSAVGWSLFLTLPVEAWQMNVFGGVLAIYSGWRISKAIGSRLRDMGWPRWTGIFAGLPIYWIILVFWPTKRTDVPTDETPPDTQSPPDAAEKHQDDLSNPIHSEPPATESRESPTITTPMKSNEYEVIIPEGKDIGEGYVEMRHNTQYSLNIKNHGEMPCDAEVTIDGIHVGTWRVKANDEIQVERPVHDTGHFTFFKVGTDDAHEAGIAKNSNNGLISVLFKPEEWLSELNAAPLTVNDYVSGGTGLTGESSQRFGVASRIKHDMDRSFTIHLRLVACRSDIRPLAARSTAIPSPVD